MKKTLLALLAMSGIDLTKGLTIGSYRGATVGSSYWLHAAMDVPAPFGLAVLSLLPLYWRRRS